MRVTILYSVMLAASKKPRTSSSIVFGAKNNMSATRNSKNLRRKSLKSKRRSHSARPKKRSGHPSPSSYESGDEVQRPLDRRRARHRQNQPFVAYARVRSPKRRQHYYHGLQG